MTKKVVLTCRTLKELKGSPERVAERTAQIAKMVAEGKTDGISNFVPPATAELTFIDQAAAEEWVTWGTANLTKYGITPVSLEIQ
jgi:hypothetical protein